MDVFLNILSVAGKILVAILAFGLLVFVHEGAHFLVARLSGIRVNEFAMGMGPKLFQIKGKQTVYTLRLFPIGGFCSMEGEDEESEDPNAFGAKPVYKRFAVVAAGALTNILLGFLILVPLKAQLDLVGTNRIHSFQQDATSNAVGGLQVGDEIKSINGYAILSSDDIRYAMLRDTDGKIDFEVQRDGKDLALDQVPFQVKEIDGQKYERIDFVIVGLENNLWLTLKEAGASTVSMVRQVVLSIFDLITGRVPMKELSGPVGITEVITQTLSVDVKFFFELVAMISINMGVMNLLPLPALDGGRLVFLTFEGIFRKPIPPKFEGVVHFVGLVLLLGLMLVITFQDVVGLFS